MEGGALSRATIVLAAVAGFGLLGIGFWLAGTGVVRFEEWRRSRGRPLVVLAPSRQLTLLGSSAILFAFAFIADYRPLAFVAAAPLVTVIVYWGVKAITFLANV